MSFLKEACRFDFILLQFVNLYILMERIVFEIVEKKSELNSFDRKQI